MRILTRGPITQLIDLFLAQNQQQADLGTSAGRQSGGTGCMSEDNSCSKSDNSTCTNTSQSDPTRQEQSSYNNNNPANQTNSSTPCKASSGATSTGTSEAVGSPTPQEGTVPAGQLVIPSLEYQVSKLEELSRQISKQLTLAEKVAARNKAAMEASGFLVDFDGDNGPDDGNGNGSSAFTRSGNVANAAAALAAMKRQSIHRASIACSPIPETEMLNAATSFEELGAYNAMYCAARMAESPPVSIEPPQALSQRIKHNAKAEDLEKLSASQRSLPALLPSHLAFLPAASVGYPPTNFLPSVIQNPASPGLAVPTNKNAGNNVISGVPQQAHSLPSSDLQQGYVIPMGGAPLGIHQRVPQGENISPSPSPIYGSGSSRRENGTSVRQNGNVNNGNEMLSGGSSFDSDWYGSGTGGSKSGINYLETSLGPKIVSTAGFGGAGLPVSSHINTVLSDEDGNATNSDGDSGYDKQSSLNNNNTSNTFPQQEFQG